MCFCKKNPYLKSYKQFCILPLYVVGAFTRDSFWWVLQKTMFVYRSKGSNVSYFTKGKPVSSWLISKSSDSFIYKTSFVLLIRDRRFVLFSPSHGHEHPSYERFCLRRLAEVRKMYLYHFKYGYMSYKNASIRYRRPPGAVWCMF